VTAGGFLGFSAWLGGVGVGAGWWGCLGGVWGGFFWLFLGVLGFTITFSCPSCTPPSRDLLFPPKFLIPFFHRPPIEFQSALYMRFCPVSPPFSFFFFRAAMSSAIFISYYRRHHTFPRTPLLSSFCSLSVSFFSFCRCNPHDRAYFPECFFISNSG